MKKVMLILLAIYSLSWGVDRVGVSDSITLGDFVHAIYEQYYAVSIPSDIVDSATVRDMVNRVCRDVSEKMPDACVRKDTIITTVKDNWYDLNSDCIDVNMVLVGIPDDSTWVPVAEIDSGRIGYNVSSKDEYPKSWWQYGNEIYLEPVNNSGDSVIIFYQARANNMSSDTVTTNITSKYFETVVAECVARLKGLK